MNNLPIHHGERLNAAAWAYPHGLHGLTVLDDETIEWLLNTCPEI